MKVFLVEDNDINCEAMRLTLMMKGHVVDYAASGEVALVHLQKEVYDVVLMDIGLPGVDGLTVTKLLREAGYTAPIVALSAHATTAHQEEAERSGCTEFVTKPITGKALNLLVMKYEPKAG
jgi:CheY-like chemotaxis protein